MRRIPYIYIAICLFGFINPIAQAEDIAPEQINGAETVNIYQVKELYIWGVAFIDIRNAEEYDARHIPSAINLPVKDQLNETNLFRYVSKDAPFVIYGNGSHSLRTAEAVEKAISWGFTEVKYFRDGLETWRKGGSPVNESVR